jgi:hypothetical protein
MLISKQVFYLFAQKMLRYDRRNSRIRIQHSVFAMFQ